MSDATIWWVLAGAVVAIELATGTFYLLMIGIGLACAALAASLGVPMTGQIVTAAVVATSAVLLWHFVRGKRGEVLPANDNPDVQIDVGESVHIAQWNADGTAPVKYRGANWLAVLSSHPAAAPEASPHSATGQFRITGLTGNRLVVEKI